jgi:metal-responsive CopG/Arc/MetJ family transcriptional regulator
MANPKPDISAAHAAWHRKAPTTRIAPAIDTALLERVDAARGKQSRVRVIEEALELWLERQA